MSLWALPPRCPDSRRPSSKLSNEGISKPQQIGVELLRCVTNNPCGARRIDTKLGVTDPGRGPLPQPRGTGGVSIAMNDERGAIDPGKVRAKIGCVEGAACRDGDIERSREAPAANQSTWAREVSGVKNGPLFASTQRKSRVHAVSICRRDSGATPSG